MSGETPFEHRFAAALRLAQPTQRAQALAALAVETPSHVAVRRALVHACLEAGAVDAALDAARHSSVLDAKDALADVLADFAAARAWPQQIVLLGERAARHPGDYDAALALAAALHRSGRPSEALAWCDRAHRLRPGERSPIEIRATALVDRGDVEEGLTLYRDLLAHGADAAAHARYLVLMHYDPAEDNRHLFESLRQFAERHLRAPSIARARSDGDPDGRLRIGWLSPRFGDGPVARFLTGLLAAFDRRRHRHVLIALQPAHDAAAQRLQALADQWLDLSGLDDRTLLMRLRALELDVLIDLAGHATANRIAVVAERVAPLQVSWLDWFDTTAVPAMDGWISDAWLTPDGSTQRYTERVAKLASGRFCYTPPHDAPPATHAGGDAIVFASFQRLAKLNAEVVATWSAILHRVPGAELRLGARLLDEPATRAHTLERFAAHGIGAERLRCAGLRPYPDLMAAYREVDIALDPFPFSGCTTTCDALYMGAAVITLPGETFVSRQSAGLLCRLGDDEGIARDRSDYVERAVAFAGRARDLRARRERQRERVLERLCDAPTHAREFAAALRELREA